MNFLEYDSIMEDALIAADRQTNTVPLSFVYELIKRAYDLGRREMQVINESMGK